MNYYKILNLDNNCNGKDIKKQYIKLAKKYHPDKNGDLEKFKLISEAYEILSDPEKKYKYDNNIILEYHDIFVNPFDLFNEIINKSDIVFLRSKKNNYLYSDFDINDNIKESVFLTR